MRATLGGEAAVGVAGHRDVVLFGAAPIPAALAACLGLLGLFGLTRLASFYFFAVCGALVAFVAAVVSES